MEHLEHYPKVLHLEDLKYFDTQKADSEYIVEEKVDGSQFRFGIIDGKRFYGSHNIDYNESRHPDKMFELAVKGANEILDTFTTVSIDTENTIMRENKGSVVFFAEFLKSPRHNTLTYSRIPSHNLVIFDIAIDGWYVSREVKESMAWAFGFETVPLLHSSKSFPSSALLDELIKQDSFLGNTRIEGVVVKNYDLYAERFNMVRPLLLKYVRDDFKELNNKNWNEINPKSIEKVWDKMVNCQQVYNKALQHIRESGKYTGELRDIAPMIEEIRKDVETEYKTLLIEAMWKFHEKELVRWITRGLPSFYKKYLYDEAYKTIEG